MKTTEIFESVNLNEIKPSTYNFRKKFDEENLQELAQSMEKNGLIHPLTLRPLGENSFEIVCGERRYHAALRLKWKTIDAYIKNVTDKEAQELCLIENIQREDVTPLEEAKAFEKLLQTTGDINELITRTGKSANYIRVRLQLNSLIPEIANLLNQEEISLGIAAVICSYSEEIQREINERFYNILNGRMIEKRVTIFTSNCKIEELNFDDRITNRIVKMALPVQFPDESIRTAIARKENDDLLDRLLGV